MTPEAIRFLDLLGRYNRIAIAGGPRTGKSTLSRIAAETHEVIGTDDYKTANVPWQDIPHRMLADVKDRPRFVIEGVQVARMLRKAAQQNEPPPVDVVVWRATAKVPRSKGQESMAKAVRTVMLDWLALTSGRVPVVRI